MSHSITVRKSYKYRLYRCDRKDKKLRHKLFVASTIWNHFIALQRRYYRLTGKYITLNQMNNHVLKLRRMRRFVLWRDLHSQACQDVCRRVDDGYQRFFNGLAKGRPRFRKAGKYRSFTFPQSGYQMVQYNHNQPKGKDKFTRARSTIRIDGVEYKFTQHRPMQGQIKTLMVKRDTVGRLWLVFSVVDEMTIEKVSTGKSGGFDFGLKTFLTDDEGRSHSSPLFYTQNLDRTRRLHRALSRKVAGSKRHKRAQQALARHSEAVANARLDHHFKLAHELCNEYDVLCFEDLNLQGMKALWGRKVSDLGFAQFLRVLEWVALKRGKQVIKIDRFTLTTKTCSGCGQKHDLTLRDRTLHCECGLVIDRDHNAAINIKTAGASA
ncbi:MAG: transposase [Anaerolineae bacterium]|nr:transposase [Anaerolineae bacterium]